MTKITSLNGLALIVLWLAWIKGGYAQDSKIFDTCVHRKECSDCIKTFNCAWCIDPNFQENRCFLSNSKSSTCEPTYIYDPKTTHTSESSSNNNDFPFSLQKINLTMRVGDVREIDLTYTVIEYPVDLYYLMDLSRSMTDDKKKLSELSQNLTEKIKNYKNLRLGFGSFVDKPVRPFLSSYDENYNPTKPCDECDPLYSYKNHMSLSDNLNLFNSKVQEAKISESADEPEGGFDALMQTIVCQKYIEWREKSRKLVIFATDSSFHAAGDGRLGVVVEPNDKTCHMTHNEYNESATYDYPTVAELNDAIKTKRVNVLWAVTKNQTSIYEKLTKHVEGSRVDVLDDDTSNIIDLIDKNYRDLLHNVEFNDNASDYVTLRYSMNCQTDNDNYELNEKKCIGVEIDQRIRFKVKIGINECPVDEKERNQVFEIYPIGLGFSLIVNLKMICGCDCDGGNDIKKSCNGHGTLKCGVCTCDTDYAGINCDCDKKSAGSDVTNCYPINVNDAILCSDRGECLCNKCVCYPINDDNPKETYTGQYCERNDYSCPRGVGVGGGYEICSGTNNGHCNDGTCECEDGWVGDDCGYCASNDACGAHKKNLCPDDKIVCDTFRSGSCVCHANYLKTIKYEECNVCMNCPRRCDDFDNCLSCLIVVDNNKIASLKKINECKNNCLISTTDYVLVDDEESRVVTENEIPCRTTHRNGCSYNYVYTLNGTTNSVLVQKKLECPIIAPLAYNAGQLFGIVVGVIGGILLVGLVTLASWKLFAIVQDRKEYAEFMRERDSAKWQADGNPLYQGATSTYQNPAFGSDK